MTQNLMLKIATNKRLENESHITMQCPILIQHPIVEDQLSQGMVSSSLIVNPRLEKKNPLSQTTTMTHTVINNNESTKLYKAKVGEYINKLKSIKYKKYENI